ncbi:glycosyltransferase family 9 protein [bacterium]|nr:glycosyltransferase family 9 protein [bacterium]
MEEKEIKILIVRLSALGDVIHTLPLLSALKELYPKSVIDWIVEDKASQFLRNNPLINNLFVVPKKKWKKRKNKFQNFSDFISIVKRLRETDYDLIIDVQQLLKSAVWVGAAKGKRKIAQEGGREFSTLFSNEIIKTDRKIFDINYHVVKRNLDIAKYLGWSGAEIKFPLPPSINSAKEKADELLKEIKNEKPTIILAPSTTWSNKHWKNENWAKLIKTFSDKANIIITASANEKKLTDEIISMSEKEVINLTGKTNLKELREVLSRADIVISPDSGSAHIAWAVNKPKVITLFFSTSRNRTAPFGENYYSVQSDEDCSPCMKRKCRFQTEECRNKIDTEKIINIVNNILT